MHPSHSIHQNHNHNHIRTGISYQMARLFSSLSGLVSAGLLLGSVQAFIPASRLPTKQQPAATLGRPRASSTPMLMMTPDQSLELVQSASNLLLAYADDSKASLNTEIGVVSFAGVAAGLTVGSNLVDQICLRLLYLLTQNPIPSRTFYRN
jgi:hypothetical protein